MQMHFGSIVLISNCCRIAEGSMKMQSIFILSEMQMQNQGLDINGTKLYRIIA